MRLFASALSLVTTLCSFPRLALHIVMLVAETCAVGEALCQNRPFSKPGLAAKVEPFKVRPRMQHAWRFAVDSTAAISFACSADSVTLHGTCISLCSPAGPRLCHLPLTLLHSRHAVFVPLSSQTQLKGWGLRVCEDVKAGQFLLEVGGVICVRFA